MDRALARAWKWSSAEAKVVKITNASPAQPTQEASTRGRTAAKVTAGEGSESAARATEVAAPVEEARVAAAKATAAAARASAAGARVPAEEVTVAEGMGAEEESQVVMAVAMVVEAEVVRRALGNCWSFAPIAGGLACNMRCRSRKTSDPR